MLGKIIKLFSIVFLLSFLMLFLIAGITDNIKSNSFFAFIGYFCFTLFTIKIYEKKLPAVSIIIILFASMFLMQSYTIYLCCVESIYSVPFILIYSLGIISGFFYLKLKRPANILPVLLCCLLAIFMFFQGWDYWLHLTNFGTFTGRVTASNLPAKFEAFDEEKNFVHENDFAKITLLDFWTTTCGVCFKKFPQLQSVHEKYKGDSSVKILAVNTPLEEDKPNQAFEAIRKREYTFPVVITQDENLAEKFGVKGYPTTFVINPDKQIIFRGDIEGAIKLIDELKSNSR